MTKQPIGHAGKNGVLRLGSAVTREPGNSSSSGVRGRLELEGLASPKRTGLGLPPRMAFNSWQRIGMQLFVITESSAWWLGDWLLYGEAHYSRHYRKAVEETGLDYQTLRNYAWVARKFSRPRRRETLTFQHHAEVAGLAEEEQDLWLERAERLGWSRNELRRQLRAERAERGRQPAQVPILLQLPQNRHDLWREAAQSIGQKLEEWMLITLDEAARRAIKGNAVNGNGNSQSIPGPTR